MLLGNCSVGYFSIEYTLKYYLMNRTAFMKNDMLAALSQMI